MGTLKRKRVRRQMDRVTAQPSWRALCGALECREQTNRLPAHCWPIAINNERPAASADLADESIFSLFSITCPQDAGLRPYLARRWQHGSASRCSIFKPTQYPYTCLEN